jgi:serine/threonine protein kinase
VSTDDDLGPFEGDVGLPSVLRAGYQVGGRYTLERPLGHGGYGSLWAARDDRTNDTVAIKVLRATVMDTGFREAALRLEREARVYGELDHPAIARLRDFGTTDQSEPYLVMDLLHGRDLTATLGKDGQLGAARAVELLLPIADALGAAHAHGVIHRDVKPGNIFFAERPDGSIAPKLIDFGVAKLRDVASPQHLTGAGVRIGSPSYMSPEQARGREVDARSDVWSFCVVLYRAITGRLPFIGKNQLMQRIAILDAAPPTFAELGVDSPALYDIVAKGLMKDPEARWQSMGALSTALSTWLAAPER